MTTPGPSVQLGQVGAWFNPRYDDGTRMDLVVQPEALGYSTAWLGLGQRSMRDLAFVERVLEATATITVATAIVSGSRPTGHWVPTH